MAWLPTTQLCATWRVGEEEVVAADDRLLARPVPRWTVENSRKVFALADLQISRLAFILQILRLEADDGVGEEDVAPADLAWALQRRVKADLAAFAQLNLRTDDRVGADDHARAELRARINQRSGMDLRFGHPAPSS